MTETLGDTDRLIERLRAVDISWSETGEICAEAAATIASQREALDGLVEGLEAIAELLDDEIKVRFRTSHNKSEGENAKGSRLYTLLHVPRDMALNTLAKHKGASNG